jgi:hydrogenase nickel incorporation protein HypA/HybF
MHEATIAAGVLGIASRAAAAAGRTRVTWIEVSIGRLRAVEPALVESCFGFLAADTVCEGADLVVNLVPVTARCEQCGVESRVEGYRFACAACGSNRLAVTAGRELRVDRVLAS